MTPPSMGVVPISDANLALSVVFVVGVGAISAAFRLGLVKSLLWGTVRCVVQLLIMGYALTFIFAQENILVLIAIIGFMAFFAVRAIGARAPSAPEGIKLLSFGGLLASTYLVTAIVVGLIVRPEPLFTPRVAIPIAGMILGNAMNGISIAVESMFSSMKRRAPEIEARLALGANPWEASRPVIREALRLGLTPTINSLMTVGLVSLPGMMTGQILGGADPQTAVRYQIVVMLMIAGASAMGSLILVGLGYRKAFSEEKALKPSFWE